MKRRNLLLLPLLGGLVMTSLFSCGVDRWSEYYPLTGRDLWIDSVMRQDYLWSEDIPASKNLNYFQEPKAFLKSLLSERDKGFSTIDTLYDTPLPSYGFDYTLYKMATSDSVYNALITYVVPHSPASNAGLDRGDWIMMVDGDSLTTKREPLLVSGGNRKLLIGKYLVQKDEEGKEVGVIQPYGEVRLNAAAILAETPIAYTSIIELGTSKVGYLVYNSFSSGKGDNGKEYNDQLLELSSQFKQAGINDFVLDLRYNPGGEMEPVQLLADILVPFDKLESPLAFLQYSQRQSAKNRDLILDGKLLQGGANLNLPKVYILTGSLTAGAPEMLINCLKPYMTVVLIGENTKGENVATATYTHPQHPWALRPVVCQVFNSQGESEYANGFKPDYAVNASSFLANYLPLGNINEALLNTALNVILGNIKPLKTDADAHQKEMSAVRSMTMKRNLRSGLIAR